MEGNFRLMPTSGTRSDVPSRSEDGAKNIPLHGRTTVPATRPALRRELFKGNWLWRRSERTFVTSLRFLKMMRARRHWRGHTDKASRAGWPSGMIFFAGGGSCELSAELRGAV